VLGQGLRGGGGFRKSEIRWEHGKITHTHRFLTAHTMHALVTRLIAGVSHIPFWR
jgi:hypothetical protein